MLGELISVLVWIVELALAGVAQLVVELVRALLPDRDEDPATVRSQQTGTSARMPAAVVALAYVGAGLGLGVGSLRVGVLVHAVVLPLAARLALSGAAVIVCGLAVSAFDLPPDQRRRGDSTATRFLYGACFAVAFVGIRAVLRCA